MSFKNEYLKIFTRKLNFPNVIKEKQWGLRTKEMTHQREGGNKGECALFITFFFCLMEFSFFSYNLNSLQACFPLCSLHIIKYLKSIVLKL